MKPLRTIPRTRSGQGSVTVELAVILPVFLLILFGICEFGRVMMVSQMLNSAAREGARVAALPGTSNSMVIERITQELANAGLTPDGFEFIPADVSTAARNQPVSVRVRINYESIAWAPGFIPGLSGVQLKGVVIMRKEGFS